jgi:hypothetical protein
VIDPTNDEIHFIRRLAARQGEISLYGDFGLLNIKRLIPEYVTHESIGIDTGRFTLTEKGWQLAQLIERRQAPLMMCSSSEREGPAATLRLRGRMESPSLRV